MSEQEQTPSQKYGLAELERGKYFDSKMNQNLILKQNYVEASGDEFQKKLVAMVLYAYEGGKNRTETAEAFVNYGEAYLELVESSEEQQELIKDDAIEVDSEVIEK